MPGRNMDKRLRDSKFDRRFDQLLETGRQVVDGVAGNRPGKRNNNRNVDRKISSRFNTVGQWVEDKLEWLLEEDEEWLEPKISSERTSQIVKYAGNKRPLDAISRRVLNKRDRDSVNKNVTIESKEEWPDESTFRLDTWERNESKEDVINSNNSNQIRPSSTSLSRPLPRSSRRKV